MKLWLLRRSDGGEYDTFTGFVIRAKTVADAREIAMQACRNYAHGNGSRCADPECIGIWESEPCVEITADGESGVILSDFYEP